jgi:uncharacterized membrane protein
MAAPLELIVSVYNDPDRARRMLADIRRSIQNGNLEIKDAAILVKDERGQVRLDDTQDVTPGQGALFGAVTGGLIGLLGGPVGAVAGAVAGAATGGISAALIDMGFSNDQLQELQASMPAGSSALVILIEHSWIEKLVDELGRERSTLFRHGLNPLTMDQYNRQNQRR